MPPKVVEGTPKRKEMTMTSALRIVLVIALLSLTVLLCGCPPGGARGQNQQNMPSGMLPPPGLQSGGARTLMGTTITAPEDCYLVVKFELLPHAPTNPPAPGPKWQSCRRVIPCDGYLLIEGLNYDGRDEAADKDVNQILPTDRLSSFLWKYESKPAPPAPTRQESGKKGR